jgi:hypothetical protein
MRSLIGTVAICVALSRIALAQDFSYQQFDVPGARLTRPLGVNDSGQIVGLYRDAANVPHGFFRHSDGTYERIDYPGATFTNASSINDRGDIVGRWTDAAGLNHGYLMTRQGTFLQIDPPLPCVLTSLQTVIHGIDDRRDLAGRCFDATGKELGWVWHHDGTFRVFDDSSLATSDAWSTSNTGVVAGDYRDASGFVHGFVWSARHGLVPFDVPGYQTGVRAVAERGDVSGIYAAASGRFHGFVTHDGVIETIDYPESVDGGGTLVINNRGSWLAGLSTRPGASMDSSRVGEHVSETHGITRAVDSRFWMRGQAKPVSALEPADRCTESSVRHFGRKARRQRDLSRHHRCG